MRRAWHFVGPTLRDGRPIPADGEWLVYVGSLVLCESGLHASEHPFDAFKYASMGSTLCEVELDGEILRDTDKLVAARRRIIRRIDAVPLLRDFARWCALQVIHLWDAPPVVREYLETGREEIRAAAEDAAWDAACDAARAASSAASSAAAWPAAWDAVGAAWDAVGAAARDAAWAAAEGVAGDVAWYAAVTAARDAQREHFTAMVNDAFMLLQLKGRVR